MGSVFRRARRVKRKPVKEKKWTIKFQAEEEIRAKLRHRGESRALAYQLAGLAGLRFNEVKTLTWADVCIVCSSWETMV